MADRAVIIIQTTKDKLGRRWAAADLIADRYNIQDGEPALWRAMVHVVQAARNLADVIEYAERQMGPPALDWEHDPAMILQTVARIARGDTTNHENRSE